MILYYVNIKRHCIKVEAIRVAHSYIVDSVNYDTVFCLVYNSQHSQKHNRNSRREFLSNNLLSNMLLDVMLKLQYQTWHNFSSRSRLNLIFDFDLELISPPVCELLWYMVWFVYWWLLCRHIHRGCYTLARWRSTIAKHCSRVRLIQSLFLWEVSVSVVTVCMNMISAEKKRYWPIVNCWPIISLKKWIKVNCEE